MTEADGSGPIELPQWYGRCRTDPGADHSPEMPADDVRQFGPLTIFHAGRSCDLRTFGPAESPSAVLFDGYLFDASTLAAALGRPESGSPADLAAAAYQMWGEAFVDRLDGCYVVAVWDGATRRLILGHDALGRHPVFYATSGGDVWFASNILALARSGQVSRRPNRLSLAFAMLAWWPEARQTYFDAIHRLRPGHYLIVDRSSVVERKYWDPQPEDDESWLPDRHALEQFEPALQQAVDRCMSLDPRGIMLSGGLDSVTVAALAARHWRAKGDPPLVAVSARTGRDLSYEERMQSQVVAALGMPHDVSTMNEWLAGRDEVALSLEMSRELPSPSRVYWVGSYTRFYKRTAAHGIRVLLTGAGGDNWLGVADGHAADLLRRGAFVQLVRFMNAEVATRGASVGGAARRLLWRGGLRPHLDSLWARLAPDSKARYHRRRCEAALPGWLCPDPALRHELIERLLARRTPALTPAGKAPASYYRQSVRAVSNPYMDHEFETAYHMDMACGVRLVSPYHDRRLVSFFNRISPQLLLHGARYKGLLRPIVVKHLPGLGLEHQRKHYPRQGRIASLRNLRRSVDHAWAEARFDALGRLGVVNSSVVKQDMGGAADKQIGELSRMYGMVSAERWVALHTD